MTQLPTTRQAVDTAWSGIFSVINDTDLTAVVVFALLGLVATVALALYIPSSGVTTALLAQF